MHCKGNAKAKCLKTLGQRGILFYEISIVNENSLKVIGLLARSDGDQFGLKRCFVILSALIFDSSVDTGMPSLAAAPEGPATRPLLSVNAVSIIVFSCVLNFLLSNGVSV